MKMTKYLSLLLGILPTAPLCAQWELNEADGYRLIVVTDRPDALYAQGDEICFIVTLEKDGAPVSGDRVAWCVTKDTWDPKTEGQVAMRDGKAVLGGNVLHEPGFSSAWRVTRRLREPNCMRWPARPSIRSRSRPVCRSLRIL